MANETLFYFGHPKAGSTWIGGVMAGISIDLGLNFFYGQYTLHHNFSHIRESNYDIIISQNSDYQQLQKLDLAYKGFHVIRDPRDLLVSSYFSFKTTHQVGNWKNLEILRNKLNQISLEEGLKEVLDFNKGFFDSMYNWNYFDSKILEVKYEDLINDPERHLIEICEHMFSKGKQFSYLFKFIALYNRVLFRNRKLYNLLKFEQENIPTSHVKYLNKKLSFKNLSKGRTQGKENLKSHYRKGIRGDWKNYIKGDLKQYFKNQYGDLLIRLGYEKDNSW